MEPTTYNESRSRSMHILSLGRVGIVPEYPKETPMPTLFHKVWNAHTVRTLASGQTQLFVGLHLVHEVTTPQAFDMLRQHGWRVAYPDRTFGTVDHIVPTSVRRRPFIDLMGEEMTSALERN